jgi:hypothetical protein
MLLYQKMSVQKLTNISLLHIPSILSWLQLVIFMERACFQEVREVTVEVPVPTQASYILDIFYFGIFFAFQYLFLFCLFLSRLKA